MTTDDLTLTPDEWCACADAAARELLRELLEDADVRDAVDILIRRYTAAHATSIGDAAARQATA